MDKEKSVFQVSCTYTTVSGNTLWEALRNMADYLESTRNCLIGIEPHGVIVEHHVEDGDWTASVITEYTFD